MYHTVNTPSICGPISSPVAAYPKPRFPGARLIGEAIEQLEDETAKALRNIVYPLLNQPLTWQIPIVIPFRPCL